MSGTRIESRFEGGDLVFRLSPEGTEVFRIRRAGDIKIATLTVGSVTYTLPSTDGSNGQKLTTNGTGTLSWT